MIKKAFVTGGTGFIGRNLINLLVRKSWRVTALYRNSTKLKTLTKLPVSWVKGCITDSASLENIIPPGTDVVFHLAGDTNMWAKKNAQQTKVNVKGTENIIAASVQSDAATFIHTSSVAAWGDISGRVTEERDQNGGHSWINYEHSKWQGERKALKGLDNGLDVIILNPTNVVGAYDSNNWGRLFTALRDEDLPFVADGCVSIANAKEVVKAHVAAALKGQPGERYILAGDDHRFSTFLKCIHDISGSGKLPKVIPTQIFRAYARLSASIAHILNKEPSLTPELAHIMTRENVIYSSDKAIKTLGYSILPMHESVFSCYQWLKKENIL